MICKALKKKAGRYGKLELPFIIAINIKEIFCDEGMVANALFGEMVVCINRKTLGHSVDRDPRTAALRDPKRNPKNTRVSGIIILDNLNPWCIIQKSPELWHNPWASYPFPPELWQLSQWIPNNEKSIYEKKDGKILSELFRLPHN
ncbi:MAG TPA: hypothetical protein ACFYD2_10200 [Candidatus Avalokitesvara rifleensis]|uniref:hypothetical protein n=1 Tax=Candidatus Avalokitesvara rifleensis TaxID=3367620 RepID=UPI0027130322|nr:hypothetical protein [Candidatus Brocadiales bacterium]